PPHQRRDPPLRPPPGRDRPPEPPCALVPGAGSGGADPPAGAHQRLVAHRTAPSRLAVVGETGTLIQTSRTWPAASGPGAKRVAPTYASAHASKRRSPEDTSSRGSTVAPSRVTSRRTTARRCKAGSSHSTCPSWTITGGVSTWLFST